MLNLIRKMPYHSNAGIHGKEEMFIGEEPSYLLFIELFHFVALYANPEAAG